MADQAQPVKVPFLDFKAQYLTIKEKLKPALDEVLESQQFILGSAVAKLEKQCAEYCGTKYALGVSSGTDSLMMALMAVGVQAGDEVITTDYSFFATASTIARLGAKPVLVDIDPITYNLIPEQIEAAITEKTKVIMPVHLYGLCADMDAINEIGKKHGIKIIEDAAQAFGANSKGRMAGAMSDIGCFSCYPTKNFGAIGEAGLITVDDNELYNKLFDLRNHGSRSRGPYQFIGGNFRMDGLQGAALSVKLDYLDSWNDSRIAHAVQYDKEFEQLGLKDIIQWPKPEEGKSHIYHQYVIQGDRRDDLRIFLGEKNIGCGVYYERPLHHEPCFELFNYDKQKFPHSDAASERTLALPIFPELTEEQIHWVAQSIHDFYRQ